MRKLALFISLVFDGNYRCEQLFTEMKNDKSTSMTRLTHEHLKQCMRIAETEMKPDSERLLKRK
jgi:hypothetical protein